LFTDETLSWLELSLISGVGTKTFYRLLDHFGTARSVLDASPAALRQAPGVGPALVEAIGRGSKTELAKSIQLIEQQGVSVMSIRDDDYPEALKHIDDPPPLLYVKGTLRAIDRNAISIVGSRRATHYGKTVAERLAADLSRLGVTVVSGLAYGVDAAAHRGSLAAGGRTLAVLGCGVDVVYPRANKTLHEQIPTAGALISEFPMGTQPDAGLFPVRNRIVSGLSLGTLVIEAPRKSGALITARHALEQGREVFAVPGAIYSPYSEGCHRLIKDGAKLVENVFDILDEIKNAITVIASDDDGQEPRAAENASAPPLTKDEKTVFNFLSMEPAHIDDISDECRLTAQRAASALLTLELKGLARQLPGKRFIRSA
jgi:DNA processing protein